MKRVLSVFIALTLCLTLTACGSIGGDPVTKDLENYFEQMEKAFLEEEAALKAYDSVTGVNSNIDDETFYVTVSEKVVPRYREYVRYLNDVQIETEELREIHEKGIEGADTAYSAFDIMLKGIEQNDRDAMTEANNLLTDASKMLRDYTFELKKFAKEHGYESENK